MPRSYLDFRSILRSLAGPRPETPGTPPVMLVLQVREALRMIHDEGLDVVFGRHRAMAARVREWAETNDLPLPGRGILERSPTLTPVLLPPGVAADAVRVGVRRRGIQIAAATGAHRASAVRIGHMGDIRMADVDRTLRALDAVLFAPGDDREGRGVRTP